MDPGQPNPLRWAANSCGAMYPLHGVICLGAGQQAQAACPSCLSLPDAACLASCLPAKLSHSQTQDWLPQHPPLVPAIGHAPSIGSCPTWRPLLCAGSPGVLPKFVPSQLPRAGKHEAKEYLEFAKQYTSSSAGELQALADKARDKLQEAGVLVTILERPQP